MARKKSKENLELAEEHVKIAEEIVLDAAKNSEGECKEVFQDAAVALERAEGDLEDSEHCDCCCDED